MLSRIWPKRGSGNKFALARKAPFEGLGDLWLNAGLWPDGPRTPLRGVFVISGAPRSGTTWLHNKLIEIGRFKGVPADDASDVGPEPFLTDENRYVHLSLVESMLSESRSDMFNAMCNLIYLRFGVAGDLMLKSPYYSFFIGEMHSSGLCSAFIHLRRNLDSVARSMLGHPHVGNLLKADYSRSYDVISGGENYEIKHVDRSLKSYFVSNYHKLTAFDRALFKTLCFSTSFAANAAQVPKDRRFVLDYDNFAADAGARAALFKFLRLDQAQGQALAQSFRPSASPEQLPAHEPAFRADIFEAEKAAWAALG